MLPVASRYRAVFLDIGDTLLGVDHPETAYQAALAALDLHHDLEAIRRANEAAREASWAEARPGPQPPDYAVFPEEEFLWRDRLVGRLLAELGIRERLDEAREAIWNCWVSPYLFQLFPDVLPILDHLRLDGYVVGAVSNWDPRLEQVIRNTGLREHFDFLVVSEVEGYAKPSPYLFRRALDRAGVAPHQAVHVGDDFFRDVEGARGVGIQPVWLDRSGQGEQPFAPTVHSLLELPHLLAGRQLLRGQVSSGPGMASGFTGLHWVQQAISDLLGFRPAPGTLNLRLTRPADHAAWAAIQVLPGVTLAQEGFCQASLWPAFLADGTAAAVILPRVDGYPADKVELLAPLNLRQALGLRDGETLALYAGTPAD